LTFSIKKNYPFLDNKISTFSIIILLSIFRFSDSSKKGKKEKEKKKKEKEKKKKEKEKCRTTTKHVKRWKQVVNFVEKIQMVILFINFVQHANRWK